VPLTTAEWVLGLSEALRASTPPVGVTPNWGRELAEAMVIVFGTGPAKVAPFRNLLAGYTTGVVPPADSWDLLNRLEGDPEAHVRLAEFLAAAHPFDYRHWMSTPGKLQLPLSAALGRGTARVDLTPAEYGHVQPVGEVLRIEQGGSTHQYGPGSPERYFVYPHESARPEPPHDAPPVEPDLKPDKLRAFGEGWLRAFDWAGLWEIKAGSLAEDREQIQRDKERVRARRDRSVMDTPLARLDARPGRVAGDEERVHAGGARPEPRV
jgi:hypothetical protein